MNDTHATGCLILMAAVIFFVGYNVGLLISDRELNRAKYAYCASTYEKYIDVQDCIEQTSDYTVEEFIQEVRKNVK